MSGSPRRFRVLALDGGGVRGVCPAAYLAALEEQAGEPVGRFFDLITGTSTGGIIALAVAHGVPAERVLELYRDRAGRVFTPKHPALLRASRKLAMARSSLYESGPLFEELRDVLGEGALLGGASSRVCVPAVNITTGRAKVFKTRHKEEFEWDHRLESWRIAAATAAAPVYFDPVEIEGCGTFVDGGLWANTPSSVGILEGLTLGYQLGEIELLSIGTGAGVFYRSTAPGKGRLDRLAPGARNGILGWGDGLVSLAMHAQTDRAENFMHHLLDGRHRRVQFRLPEGAFELDSVGEVETLYQIASDEAKRSGFEVRQRFLDAPAAPFVPCP